MYGGRAARRWQQQHTSTRAGPGGLQVLLGRLAQQGKSKVQLADAEPQLTGFMVQQGGTCKVVPQQLQGQGRGLVASEAISKGQIVCRIPLVAVILPGTAAAGSILGPLLSAAPPLPDWSLLVLFLAEQYHYQQQGTLEASSRWQPYIQSLPGDPVGTVLDWEPGEAEELLTGTGLLPKARTILSAAELLWQDLQPVITAAKQQGLCPAGMFAKRDVDWAISICLSRSVRLDDRAGEVVLVPFADLFNHDPGCTAYLVYDQQQDAVVLRADRAYKPGEQVFVSYGPKSNGELLLSYGFTAGASNPHEAAHLTFALAPDDPCLAAKQAALSARNIPAAESFALRIDGLPAGLIPYLAFIAAPVQAAEDAEALTVAVFDREEMPQVATGVGAEQLALEALAKCCREACKRYTQQQQAADRRLADASAGAAGGGGWEQRAALVAAARLREHQILARTEFVAQQRIRQLCKGGE